MAEQSQPDSQRQADPLPLELSHQDLHAAKEAGEITPLSANITNIVSYRGYWWIIDTYTCLRVIDESTIAMLNRHTQWANAKLLFEA
ncbi:MAG: hypothetical protein QOH97_4085 [Actinoplanes sp.]|nr:hypothetical protein [Actinoplanes sp.]